MLPEGSHSGNLVPRVGRWCCLQAGRADDGRVLRTSPSDDVFFINMIILLIWNGSLVSIH